MIFRSRCDCIEPHPDVTLRSLSDSFSGGNSVIPLGYFSAFASWLKRVAAGQRKVGKNKPHRTGNRLLQLFRLDESLHLTE
jgi:hypothetical protein